jgi:hypothetical protein
MVEEAATLPCMHAGGRRDAPVGTRDDGWPTASSARDRAVVAPGAPLGASDDDDVDEEANVE